MSSQEHYRDIGRHYDDLDRYYRRIWGNHVHHGLWETGDETPEEATEALSNRVMDALEANSDHRVLDIGCGYGETTRLLAVRDDPYITALTVSKKQIDYARKRNRTSEKTEYHLENFLENGYENARFDRILSIEVLEHIDDKEKFFSEIERTLKPGGRAVLTAWLRCEKPNRIEKSLLLNPIHREGQLGGIGSASEYRRLGRQAGLKELDFAELGPQVAKTWGLCLKRTIGLTLTDSEARKFLLSKENPNRVFALSLIRLWLGFKSGTMKYGFFVYEKPLKRALDS